ncbi:MAG: NIL domain-containing protein [Planctomycetota bacterium]
MKRTIFCTVPQQLIQEPLLFRLGNQFHVSPNLRGASVTDEIAILSLELDGEKENVAAAIRYLVEKGVQVEEQREEEVERPSS